VSVRVLSQLVTTKVEADPSVAFLAIAGWLYWRYRQKQKAMKEKAKTAPATESEEEKLRKLALLKKQDAANGFIASMFSGLLGNLPQR